MVNGEAGGCEMMNGLGFTPQARYYIYIYFEKTDSYIFVCMNVFKYFPSLMLPLLFKKKIPTIFMIKMG